MRTHTQTKNTTTHNNSQVMEDVALKYVDLCVDLKKGRYAKDGLIHYRNLCQQVRVF
jgi:hypothetical protein